MPDFDDLYGGENASLDWKQITDLFGEVREKLLRLRLETREQALREENFELSPDTTYQYSDQITIRYRASDDRDLLKEYYDVAIRRISIVERLISSGRPSVALTYHLGVLLSCYGYLLNSTLAWSTDLFLDVNRKRSSKKRTPLSQLKWYAHWYDHYVNKKDMSAKKSNAILRKVICDILDSKITPPDGFDKNWFGRCFK